MEDKVKNELSEKLTEAKLNGAVDEVFVREMALQVSLLASMESDVMERTEHEDLKNIMAGSKESLQIIKQDFDSL